MSSIDEEPTRNPVPDIGEHNEEIFKSMLGYSNEDIEKLKDDGVI